MLKTFLLINASMPLAVKSIAYEDPFWKFATTFYKKYDSIEDLEMRREIFMHNYNEMLRHNQAETLSGYSATTLCSTRK